MKSLPAKHISKRPALPSALRTVQIEQRALSALYASLSAEPLAQAFERTVEMIVGVKGRVIVSGMGKSGLVARKLASTLASTGTPSLFIHPSEASHGDLGMITTDDILLALSWSGETAELSDIVSYCRRFQVPLIAATSGGSSTLAEHADIVLLLPEVEEACPNRLAPTSSAIIQAALGDALAVSMIEARGFSIDDFRNLHPKGRLGAQLLRVGDVMNVGEAVPVVAEDASILTAMLEMTSKRFGMTGVVDEAGQLVGAFSDGDLRRSLTVATVDMPMRDFMNVRPLTIGDDRLAAEALDYMNGNNITHLFVCDGGRPVGFVHIHELLRTGLV